MFKIYVAKIDRVLGRISQWGYENLVEFNAKKTQVCALSAKKSIFLAPPTFQKPSFENTG